MVAVNPLPSGSTDNAPLPGSSDTELGGKVFRQAYREGHEAGARRGTAAYLNSPSMEDLALEVTMLRETVAAMTEVATQREKLLAHYKQKFDECVGLITGRKSK